MSRLAPFSAEIRRLSLPDAPPLKAGSSAPIKPHKLPASIPPRPEAFAVPFDGHDWTVSTHTFTAAFPRVREPDTRSKADPIDREGLRLSGRELNNAVKGVFARQRSASEIDDLDEPALELQEPLLIAVNRYAPKVAPPANVPKVTLLLAHANGLHKEVCRRSTESPLTRRPGSPRSPTCSTRSSPRTHALRSRRSGAWTCVDAVIDRSDVADGRSG